MDITEQVVSKAALKATGSMIIEYQGKTFDLTPPWKKVDMTEAVAEITGVDFSKIDTDEEAQAAAIAYGMDKDEVKGLPRGKIIAEMFEAYCETTPIFGRSHFRNGASREVSPLPNGIQRIRESEDSGIHQRMGDCQRLPELNDPIDQYNRFKEQQAQLDAGTDDEAHPMDEDFVNALEVGLPPTGVWESALTG